MFLKPRSPHFAFFLKYRFASDAKTKQIIYFQVLRDQGLGKYCDPEFVRAASREMQEAMDMTPEEFDAAAHQLLAAERQGTLRLPVGPESSGWGHQVLNVFR